MPAEQTKQLCEMTRQSLKEVNEQLAAFLDYTHIPQLIAESGTATEKEVEMEQYYRHFLSDLRHLNVSCEMAYETISLVLRRAKFNREFADKVLYEVVHTCIYNFYYPRHECYEEDGRYTYTGQDAIRFRYPPAPSLHKVTISLSKAFEGLREELEYYETDYMTGVRMQRR
ncbi:YpuI family protein [Mechercharimyces sp. CAU 1602]|uniref:YpuI family protein n=1 Tax=Mechercharimyces sp. CAU 1602 TaxID=2973933 RepID=UPI002163AC34|nr:YpuI family protein [Mechercharimyces sp. CAU 1602]MCS1350082.1 YpuI family protein [Mechercharimyces sp. CAU 1602]